MRKFLYAEFTALSGCEGEVADLLKELALRVRAEPGNLAFDTHRRDGDERSFFVYEVYRDDAAFETHLAADYGAQFNRQIVELIEEPATRLTLLTHL